MTNNVKSIVVKNMSNDIKSNDIENKITSNSNTLNYKAIIAPYIEISEYNLKQENPSLFKENILSIDDLYILFLEEIKEFANKTINYTDIYRHKEANPKGGINFDNKNAVSLLRSAAFDLLKQIGKKIITGNFNLTTISIPIKVMAPVTVLQSCAFSFFQLPYYMHLAKDKNVVEKLKYIIVATISSFYCSCFFLKPLNPVLGETYESIFGDGSKIYLEQSSHHPPISHYEIYGPNKSWYFSGYSKFGSSAGLNSLSLSNEGKRCISFSDGATFKFNFFKETFKNTFYGNVKYETHGEVLYSDIKNNILCKVQIGHVNGKTKDYLSGQIIHNGIVASTLSGSYMSHIDFDNTRYWDIRNNFPIKIIETSNQLQSSALYRKDRKYLENGNLLEAQLEKEKLEKIQRNDRHLRESNNKVKHK